MAKQFKLLGVDRFMKNFNLAVQFLGETTLEGLIQAAVELYREADKTVPIDTANLRHSWFIVSIKGTKSQPSFKGDDASKHKTKHSQVTTAAQSAVKEMTEPGQYVVMFGYTANYAAFVHEKVDATFDRPSAQARWLYKAMQSSKDKMLNKIAEHAKF